MCNTCDHYQKYPHRKESWNVSPDCIHKWTWVHFDGLVKTAVTPVHWSYCSLALSRRYEGFVPNRWQALIWTDDDRSLIWTDDDRFQWCQFPSPDFSVLNPMANTLRPKQNGRHFAVDIFKFIFVNEICDILIQISLKYVPRGPVDNMPALVQMMAWHRTGDKSLSETMMA